MLTDIQTLGVPFVVLITLLSVSFGGVWWLSKQFLEVREMVYNQTERLKDILLKKMEYHEQHDDARFTAISNDIWAIKLRNASKDGYTVLEQFPEQTIARKKTTKSQTD
jgi:hypothetical protein